MKKQQKARLALDMLERELEILNSDQMLEFLGGSDLPSDCVFQNFAYIAGQLGTSHNSGYYENSYDSIYGSASSGSGVSSGNMEAFTNTHFNTAPAGMNQSEIQTFGSSGGQVMITYNTGLFDSNGIPIRHAVTVLHPSFLTDPNSLWCYDPTLENEQGGGEIFLASATNVIVCV